MGFPNCQSSWKSPPPIAIPYTGGAVTLGSILGVTLVSGGAAKVSLPEGGMFTLRNQSATANIFFGDAATLTASGTDTTNGGRLLAAGESTLIPVGPQLLAGKYVYADAASAVLSIEGYL